MVARHPGSSHDSHIFNMSSLKEEIENGVHGDGWLLGNYLNIGVTTIGQQI